MGRGLLVFKGDKPKKKKKKSKHDRNETEVAAAAATASTMDERMECKPPATAVAKAPAAAAASAMTPKIHNGRGTITTSGTEAPAAAAASAMTPKIHNGRGTITTSGTVVTGHDTKFTKDLRQGDALLIRNDDNGQDEMRVITMLLSDISINLSSPFSVNLTQPTPYRYIPKPRNKMREAKQARDQAAREAVEEEAKASGTGSAQELVYRERTTHGSYRIRRKQIADGEMSREELLNLRSKKTSDKYC